MRTFPWLPALCLAANLTLVFAYYHTSQAASTIAAFGAGVAASSLIAYFTRLALSDTEDQS